MSGWKSLTALAHLDELYGKIGPKTKRSNDDDDDNNDNNNVPEPARIRPSPAAQNAAIRADPVRALRVLGACVIVDPWFAGNVPRLVAEFDATLRAFPEYRRDGVGEPVYVLGGFAALGNASSWHNPFVRFLRLHTARAVLPVLRQVAPPTSYLAEIADRMMYRPAGVKPQADTWHRDVKPNQAAGEVVYGGWINTSTQTQYLSCVLGTQDDQPDENDPDGFAKITSRERIAEYEREKTSVEVPPGAILVFNERMVHEVLATKRDYAVRRVFLAWMQSPRIGDRSPDNIDALLSAQAPITVKSGQAPRLYPQAYVMYFIDKLTEWSVRTFVPSMLSPKVQPVTAKKLAGQTILVVPATPPSLAAARLPLYEPYRAEEIELFRVQPSHRLPVQVGSDDLAVFPY